MELIHCSQPVQICSIFLPNSNVLKLLFLLFLVDMDVDGESEAHPSGMVNGHTEKDADRTESDQKAKSKLRLSFEDYRSMARSVAGYLRAEEERGGEGKS